MHNQECGQNKETQVRSCNKILVQTPNPIVQIAAIIKSQTKDSLSIEKKKQKVNNNIQYGMTHCLFP